MMKKRKRIGNWCSQEWGINYIGGSIRIVIRNPNIQFTTYITVKQEVSRIIGKAKLKYTYLSDLETEKVYLIISLYSVFKIYR